MTRQQSLALIEQMIHTAKREQKDDGRGWILWGWLLFGASVFSLLNIWLQWNLNPFFFWNGFSLLVIVLFIMEIILKGRRTERQRVKTYTSALYQHLNTGFFISLVLIIMSMNVGVPPLKGFALLLGLYGFWILIYGAVLNFKPSLVGAYITWAFAFTSLFMPSFTWVMVLHALAVCCGYIIPGHMAHYEFKKEKLTAGV